MKQQCMICYDRNETINPKGECNKLAWKEYKTRHDWLGKAIYLKLCMEFKFDHRNK